MEIKPLFTASLLVVLIPCLIGLAYGDAWKEDFERICAHTLEATALPNDTLEQLIVQSDDLLGKIGTIDDPQKKVYIFRLKKCKNFFQYILDARKAEAAEDPDLNASQ
jgi:hypothetical protein